MILQLNNGKVVVTGKVSGRVTFGETATKRTPYLQFGISAEYDRENERTTFANVKAFGPMAERFCGMDKDYEVLVVGRKEQREYNGKVFEDIIADFITISVAPYSAEAKAAGAVPKHAQQNSVSKSLGGSSDRVAQIAAQMIADAEAEETDETLPF